MQNKNEQDKLIEALKQQVEKAESKGLFDTAHHDMLKQLLSKNTTSTKGEIKNG